MTDQLVSYLVIVAVKSLASTSIKEMLGNPTGLRITKVSVIEVYKVGLVKIPFFATKTEANNGF